MYVLEPNSGQQFPKAAKEPELLRSLSSYGAVKTPWYLGAVVALIGEHDLSIETETIIQVRKKNMSKCLGEAAKKVFF